MDSSSKKDVSQGGRRRDERAARARLEDRNHQGGPVQHLVAPLTHLVRGWTRGP
jgi:hypothetical protein